MDKGQGPRERYESARPNNGDFKLQIWDSPEVSVDDGSFEGPNDDIASEQNSRRTRRRAGNRLCQKPGASGWYRPCISAGAHQKW
jgi:hypothetical protein